MIYDKPFHSYKMLIEKLINENGLKIHDKKLALEYLSTISYYDLKNGYQKKWV